LRFVHAHWMACSGLGCGRSSFCLCMSFSSPHTGPDQGYSQIADGSMGRLPNGKKPHNAFEGNAIDRHLIEQDLRAPDHSETPERGLWGYGLYDVYTSYLFFAQGVRRIIMSMRTRNMAALDRIDVGILRVVPTNSIGCSLCADRLSRLTLVPPVALRNSASHPRVLPIRWS
jgi:hypothetical protein